MSGKIKTLQLAEGVETVKPTTLTNFSSDLVVESISAGQQAEVGKLYLVDTTGGTVALTLPASPIDNDKLAIKLTNGNNNVTFAGQTIKRPGEVMQFQYGNSSWLIVSAYNSDLAKTSTIGQVLTADDLEGGASFQDLPNDLPAAGTIGQALTKVDATDYNVAWTDIPNDLPLGGTTGTVLTKNSATDFDVSFAAIPNDLPAGGTADQVLAKVDGTDYNVNWVNQSGGGGGGLTNDGIVVTAGPLAAATQTEYLLNTSAGGFTVELPVGAANARVKLIDESGHWSTNNVSVVTNGQADYNGTGEPLTLNVGGSWIEFVWNVTDSVWETTGPTQAEQLDVYTQTKFLASPMNNVSTGQDIFVFNNLVVGRKYEYTGKVRVVIGDSIAIRLMDGATEIANHQFTANSETPSGTIVKTFTATSTTLTLEVGGIGGVNDVLSGESITYGQLKEFIPYSEGATTSLYWEEKFLGSDGGVGDLITFDTVAGKTYEISANVFSTLAATVDIKENGNQVARLLKPTGTETVTGNYVFTATGTTATLTGVGGTIMGDGSRNETFAQLKEYLPLVSANATATQAGLLPRYQIAEVELDNEFTGGELTCTVERIGNTVTITGHGIATHAANPSPESSPGLLPEWAWPRDSVSNTHSIEASRVNRTYVFANGTLVATYSTWTGTASNAGSTGAPLLITYNVAP